MYFILHVLIIIFSACNSVGSGRMHLLAALKLIDRLLTQLNDFELPINFYMDLSKAIDSLNNNILLNKLT